MGRCRPKAQEIADNLEPQAEELARRLGPLADRFPKSLRTAVTLHRVPKDLEGEVWCGPLPHPPNAVLVVTVILPHWHDAQL